jgi:hypothetical protein
MIRPFIIPSSIIIRLDQGDCFVASLLAMTEYLIKCSFKTSNKGHIN